MSYDDVVSAIIHGENLRNIPLRVTYYCRVSTDSDVQLNSLDNQISYYENYIKSNINWVYVKGYVEEGVTAVTVNKRENFQKMIKDAKLNKFDLIITKEVSRFARDLEDSIHYIRELKTNGVGILFENQMLNTFDPNSEMILNTLFSIAQEESKKLSSRVKFGHREAIKKGRVLGSSNITGYKKNAAKLVVVENEAKFIRKVFELYATDKYGLYKLSRELFNIGYTNKKGNLYDKDSLKRIISNPKYKGYYRGHTYEIMDYRTKRRKKIPIEEQIIYKCEDDSIPNIVSEELWNKANEILTKRTAGYNNNYWSGGLKYPLSSKMYCKEHNTNFQRTSGNKKRNRPTWSCGMYLKHRLDYCTSPIIAEKDLYNILNSVFNNIIISKEIIINNMISLYKNIDKTNCYDKDLKNIEEELLNIENKKALALDMILNGDLTRESLKDQFNRYEKTIKKLHVKREEIINQINILNRNYSNYNKLYKIIKKEINEETLEEIIRKFVNEIIILKIDNNRYNIRLEIFLNLFGEEKPKIKGAHHINGPLKNDILYLKNQVCNTIELKQKNSISNKFIYNVYIETL